MSGIFGAFDPESQSRGDLEARARRATQSLYHRGPDDGETWISSDDHVALGHRRLAIIDLDARARQPMKSHSGCSLITFNGEIYNYQTLRLQNPHLPKRTSSDTEVLLELLDQKGMETTLPLLDGMYAFAYFNQSERKIYLATDPAGKKPLYVYHDAKRFLFASEIKAFFAYGNLDLSLAEDGLKEYLVYGYNPYPKTIFKNICKLPAGHFQIFDLLEGARSPEKYWDIPLLGPEITGRAEDITQELKLLIRQAVKKRLVADVPVGVLLSGGLDSSVIAVEASSVNLEEKLKTFSIGFLKSMGSTSGDGSIYSRLVANKIMSDHTEVQVDSSQINVDQVLRHFDEPFGDSSCFPMSSLYQEAVRFVKVALSGDGGDELFGGHRRLRAGLFTQDHRKLMRTALMFVPIKNSRGRHWYNYLGRLKSAVEAPLMERMFAWNSFFNEAELKLFFGAQFEAHYEEAKKFAELTSGVEVGRKILYLNFKSYLFDHLLPKMDRMSMLHGLEVRSPFLDKALIEYAFLIPTKIKFDAWTPKKILKNAYRSHLGAEITDRPKAASAYPLAHFVELKSKSEDFRKLGEIGLRMQRFPQLLKSPLAQSQFFSLYAIEGFLKHFETRMSTDRDRVRYSFSQLSESFLDKS